MTIDVIPASRGLLYVTEQESSRKDTKSLSDDCDSQSPAGKVGLLERTVAFMGPLIFMTKAQVGIEMQ